MMKFYIFVLTVMVRFSSRQRDRMISKMIYSERRLSELLETGHVLSLLRAWDIHREICMMIPRIREIPSFTEAFKLFTSLHLLSKELGQIPEYVRLIGEQNVSND